MSTLMFGRMQDVETKPFNLLRYNFYLDAKVFIMQVKYYDTHPPFHIQDNQKLY